MDGKLTNLVLTIGLLLISSCLSDDGKSDAYGNFEARERIVSAQAQGKILTLDLEEGTTIKADELVGWIDTAVLSDKKTQLKTQKRLMDAKLANIEAQAEVQKEQIDNLLIEKNRIEKLREDQAATEQQYDNIMGKIRVARKKLKAVITNKRSVFSEKAVLKQQIKAVNTQIDQCQIINPLTGTVLEKYLEPAEIAAPGKAIYKVGDLSEMILRVYISGAQLPHVKIGQEVEVLIDKNSTEYQKLKGQVSWISEEAEFTPKIIQTKEERVDLVYAVKVRVKNNGTIKIGMPGEVNF